MSASPAQEHQSNPSTGRRVVANPAVQSLLVMVVVSLAAWTGFQVGVARPFVLRLPLLEPWWALPLSVYAHLSPSHLLSNALVVGVVGGVISLSTSRVRFHFFFLTTGIAAGVAQVLTSAALGGSIGVLGASGAGFALLGYILVANPAGGVFFNWVSTRTIAVVVAAVALALTVFFSSAGSAYIAHFVGGVLGLVAGRFRLLRVTPGGSGAQES